MSEKKVGRPKGRKIAQALSEVNEALEKALEIQNKMSDRQRSLFVSLLKGYDPIHACVDAGLKDIYNGISKMVTKKDGHRLYVSNLNLDNLEEVCEEDYAKLNRICSSEVNKYLQGFNHQDYVVNYKSILKFLVPEAIGVLTKAMSDKDTRNAIRAAENILDRSGHVGDRGEVDRTMPVQVNIIMNKDKTLPVVNIETEEGELVEDTK